jgi:hypothetical protein
VFIFFLSLVAFGGVAEIARGSGAEFGREFRARVGSQAFKERSSKAAKALSPDFVTVKAASGSTTDALAINLPRRGTSGV